MDTTTDKMVEIARFQYPAEAQTLIALLQSEDIDCYLRNEHSSMVMPGYAAGGVRVELLESSVPRALEVMKAGGYEIPAEDEEPKGMFDKRILVLLILLALCLGLFLYFGSLG
ncbi:MAG: DUF2007 domain-containing protein [Tannerellaceae bacterium]|jgi:hypothetical protein|nr:DUF2007 domain-containing protein [Tannerellaceae bacterium]